MAASPSGGSIVTIIVSEPAIHGVILVAGLVVILGNSEEASWDVLVKVIATLVVFWAAHVYAGAVAHLGDEYEGDTPWRTRALRAVRDSLDHSWGMLLAGVIPVVVLTLGTLNLVSDQYAIWGTLWAAVVVLGVLGWLGVASWTPLPQARMLGGVITSLLGLLLVILKALVK
jgi:hypothetical protein